MIAVKMEGITGGDFGRELKRWSHTTLSQLEISDPSYAQSLKSQMIEALSILKNRLVDRDYALHDEIKRSRLGIYLLIVSAILQSLLLFMR